MDLNTPRRFDSGRGHQSQVPVPHLQKLASLSIENSNRLVGRLRGMEGSGRIYPPPISYRRDHLPVGGDVPAHENRSLRESRRGSVPILCLRSSDLEMHSDVGSGSTITGQRARTPDSPPIGTRAGIRAPARPPSSMERRRGGCRRRRPGPRTARPRSTAPGW